MLKAPGLESVKQWQTFLATTAQSAAPGLKESLDPGKIDGYFGNHTVEATKAFQRQNDLPQTGEVDDATAEAAKKAVEGLVLPEKDKIVGLAKTSFEIGPHQQDSLRECRPYFLVPLVDERYKVDREAVLKQIVGFMEARKKADRKVTDIYILSHGWHRNFFGALEAYDKLVARFARLFRRGRLVHRDENFSPLFITLHWHSDLGEDSFEDQSGRRNKTSFISNVRASFEPHDKNPDADAKMLSDFEDIFEFLSQLCAPGFDHTQPAAIAQSQSMAELITHYRIRYTVNSQQGSHDEPMLQAERVAVVWECYEESMKRQPLVDQGQRAWQWGNFFSTWKNTFMFVVSVVGAAAILGLFRNLPVVQNAADWLSKIALEYWNGCDAIAHKFITAPFSNLVSGLGLAGDALAGVVRYLVQPLITAERFLLPLAIGGWLILYALSLVQRAKPSRSSGGLPILQLIAFLPAFLFTALPLIYLLVVSCFLVGPIMNIIEHLTGRKLGSKFFLDTDERPGKRGEAPPDLENIGAPKGTKRLMSFPARSVVDLLQSSVGKDSSVVALAGTISNQFAFWDMQALAQKAAAEAALAISKITDPKLNDGIDAANPPRIHLIGHSFGGLLVANLSRYLAYGKCKQDNLDTVCLLQGALGAGWFVREHETVKNIKGALACIYSRYDSANGFYFPASNSAKLAGGFVGLSQAGDCTPEQRCGFISLSSTPYLDDPIYMTCPQQGAQKDKLPRILNLDASRLIYQGAAAAGGGHTDIFKDDVVHLIWAVTTQR